MLDEFVPCDEAPCHAPLAAKRRYEADNHNQAGVQHQLRDLGNAADVLHPILVSEAEIAVEAMTDVVAVEEHCVTACPVQRLLDEVGDGRFSGTGQASQPHDAGLLPLERGARLLVKLESLPMDVRGSPQREVDRAAGESCVGHAVDQDEIR